MGNNRLKEIHKFLDENDNSMQEELIKSIRKDFNLSVTGAMDIYFSWKKQYLVSKTKVNYFGRCGRKQKYDSGINA